MHLLLVFDGDCGRDRGVAVEGLKPHFGHNAIEKGTDQCEILNSAANITRYGAMAAVFERNGSKITSNLPDIGMTVVDCGAEKLEREPGAEHNLAGVGAAILHVQRLIVERNRQNQHQKFHPSPFFIQKQRVD